MTDQSNEQAAEAVAKRLQRQLRLDVVDAKEVYRTVLATLQPHDAENGRLRAALEEIINPIKFMQQRAKAEGGRLSEMAYSIAMSISHLQGIAKAALNDSEQKADRTASGCEHGLPRL